MRSAWLLSVLIIWDNFVDQASVWELIFGTGFQAMDLLQGPVNLLAF